MTKKINKKKIIIILILVITLIIILRIVNGIKIIESRLEEKVDLYFRVTINDEVLYGQTDVTKTYNLIPGFVKVNKNGSEYMTYDNNMKYTHNKYKLVNTENTNELILNVEVYKCYKNKSVNSCDNEVTDFKKQNIKIDEVEIRKTGISCGKYNQVVYKGKFGKHIYSYIKDTDYYRVLFKYKDGSKTYNIEYSFFTNILQPEVL